MFWAMDSSLCLVVQAEEDSAEAVALIAEQIGKTLGGQFVRETVEE